MPNNDGEANQSLATEDTSSLPAHRHNIHNEIGGGFDTSVLLEAHGLVTDMLLDHAALPAHIVAGLKALATMLTPPAVTAPSNPRPRPPPFSLPTDPDYTSDIDDIPYTAGEKFSSLPKRSGLGGRKGMPPLHRRMSTSTWTTTTSATGMPTLEPQPNSRRRSTTFRPNIEGTPGSSPTQVVSLDRDKDFEGADSRDKRNSARWVGFSSGWAGHSFSSCAAVSSASAHKPNNSLQGSHKARSFSANALYASTDSRRRSSTVELTSGSQRKTVCSLHPLTSSDLTHLSALAASTAILSNKRRANVVQSSSLCASVEGSLRSSPSPGATPNMSPFPSPLPSRDPSPCNYQFCRSRDNPPFAKQVDSALLSLKYAEGHLLSLAPSSESLQGKCTEDGDFGAGSGVLLSPHSVPSSSEEDGSGGGRFEPDALGGQDAGRKCSELDNCSTVSTLGDGQEDSECSGQLSPPLTCNSTAAPSVSLDSQTPFSFQQPNDSVIVSKDGVRFDLCSIATDALLCRLGEWDYPIFDLQLSSKTQILSHMCYKVFLDVGLFETFKIPIKEFINYFHALEMGYRDKPYHNRMHAADVLHGVYYLTTQPIPGFEMIVSDPETPGDVSGQRNWFNVDESCYGIMGANFPSLELMALYTAAAMHDYDHPGRTNAFLVTTNAPQAILYNDRSVLENHHAASAWSLLFTNDDCNFLKYLDKAEFKRFRYLVIEAILATDLKRHFEILSEFNTKVNEDDSVGIDWNLEADRLLVMEMCIKLADINGPCKFHDIHVQWTHRIAEEFYEQGDEEAKLGLPISPYMDRNNPQLAKLQESFINHLVAPLCKACTEAGILPGFWEYDDEDGDRDGTADDASGSCHETDNENDDSSYSDEWSDKRRAKGRIFCVQSKHLQDNHLHWMNVIREETRRMEEVVKTESVAISTDDQMETIEEENNTPLSLNRSFSFEKEDSKL